MNQADKEPNLVLGKARGRRVAPMGSAAVHRSNWMPDRHPGTSPVPYLLSPVSISHPQNYWIREIWQSSRYAGREFAAFAPTEVPGKQQLAQILACGLKAACATYSQHWQGMYFDWTFNEQCREALARFRIKLGGERFVENAFATVVLLNTGYGGGFQDMLRFRRRPIPPSLLSLEQIDMGTFEHNLKSAVGAVLGGRFGVNVIRQSLAREMAEGPNREGSEALKKLVMLPGMNPAGRLATVIQLGFKQPADRVEFDPEMMKLAGAKLIERKSERRNADFSRTVPFLVMSKFFRSARRVLREFGVEGVVKTLVIEGNTPAGAAVLARIRERINQGLDLCHRQILEAYEANRQGGLIDDIPDLPCYKGFADFVVEAGRKVLKPREDGHQMVFFYLDLKALAERGVPVDVAEQAAGEAIQAGLNSVHLDGTTNVPADQDLRFGAFCLTGPIHSAELLDSDEQLNRGWGQGFWDLLAPEFPPANKMLAVVAVCAKHEQDAMIAEIQAMEQRKSVNDIFWYRTWNHPEGKQLDLPPWIAFPEALQVLPIPGNDVRLLEERLPQFLPPDHPLTQQFRQKNPTVWGLHPESSP